MDDFYLAQLRHAYWLLMNGHVCNQKMFADGLIAPIIRNAEKYQAINNPDSTGETHGRRNPNNTDKR